jgi:hypothetical protein
MFPKRRSPAIISIVFLALSSVSARAESDPHRFDQYLKTDWYGVYMQGAKIGYAEMGLERVPEPVDGWRVRSAMTMIISAAGTTDTMITSDIRLFESPGGELYSSKFTIKGSTGDIVVEGKKETDEFIITTTIGGQSLKKIFDYPLDYLDSLAYLKQYISSGKAAVGDTFTITYFEATPPLTGLVHQKAKIESLDQYIFNGVPTDVYTVNWTFSEMNMTGRSVIDRSGNELESTVGAGMLMKLENELTAKQLDVTFDILSDNVVRVEKSIGDPKKLKFLRLIITGIEMDDIIQTGNQIVSVDSAGKLIAEIKKQDYPSDPLILPIESSRLRPFLEAGPYIQSGDEEIIKQARDIVGDEKDSYKAARKINAWVSENVEDRFTADMSNALQTLHSRQGDCGEHAVLSVALMRAAGIPARPVAGLVYSSQENGFAYHAWTEVFVGGWVMMDPSWGEDLINPTHIALARGDILEQTSIIYRVLGRISIEVVEAR